MPDNLTYEIYDSYDPITNTYSDKKNTITDFQFDTNIQSKDTLIITDSPPEIIDQIFFNITICLLLLFIILLIIKQFVRLQLVFIYEQIIILILILFYILLILSCVFNGKKIFSDKELYYYKNNNNNYIYKNIFTQNKTSVILFSVSVGITSIYSLILLFLMLRSKKF